ncbi:MAG TPA: hypothetical protein DCL49_08355, partial [Candidatus Omnitrophica bacterium]|nr:hypothetical protein [Candidatus Omnitrophota bacterium]
MQYLTRALKALGLEVIIVEPYYPYEIDKEELKKRIADKSIDWEDPPLKAFDYEKLPIPLRVPKKPDFHVTVMVQGKVVKVDVFKTENDERVPVYLYKDRDEFFTKLLYFYGKGQKHPTAFEVSEFLTKAGLMVIDHIENKMMKDEGDAWVPPVIASQDGQALLASVWSLFHKDFQTKALVLAHYMSTTHTYRNTIYGEGDGARQYLLRAGVPENWLWLFKRLMPKGDGRYVYDLTRAGLIATLIRYGFANGVSDAHATEIRRFTPQVFHKAIYGITNGDLISLTLREFARKFVELGYGSQEAKNRLEELQRNLREACSVKAVEQDLKTGNFDCAQAQRELDEYLYEQLWRFVDNPDSDRNSLTEMFVKVQYELKMEYIDKHIKPYLVELNIQIPEEFKGQENLFWKKFAALPWVGYSGRWVNEKWGLLRAFTEYNIKWGLKHGMVFIILANPQFYRDTEKGPDVNSREQFGGSYY